MHAYDGPAELQFPDGSTFDLELAPGRPPTVTDPPTEAGLRECGDWVPVAAFAY